MSAPRPVFSSTGKSSASVERRGANPVNSGRMSAASLASLHVAVLMGGISAEREVSLVSGAACADALDRLGARVSRIDAGRDLATVLGKLRPDVCFNALHGEWGE